MTEDGRRRELADICVRLYGRGLTVSAGGNMSVRLDDGTILITPSGRNKGMLGPEDMVKVSMDGRVLGTGRPSVETGMHLALYRARKDVNAVVHCHPLYCTALSVKGHGIRGDLTPEGVLLLRNVPTVGYFTPGTEELAEAVARMSFAAAMLMEKHGALTQGRTLEEAFNRMEELEFQARLQFVVGDADGLAREEVERILGV